MRVGVIGAGAFGTTLAALVTAAADAVLWAREPDVVTAINQTGENSMFLPGFRLPPSLRATNDIEAAVADADVVIVAVPSKHLRTTIGDAAPYVPPDATVVSLAKGIEADTLLRMSQVLHEVLEPGRTQTPDRIGVLSGPNVARELMSGDPGAASVAFLDTSRAGLVQALFAGTALRLYTTNDVVGVELGGACKNVTAIAAGVADGLGYGMNTKAAIISRGLAEAARLGNALGAQPLTFLGLAGSGDLVATCTSPHSRNRRVGEQLATGAELGDTATGGPAIAEGVTTAPSLLALGRSVGIDLPIAAAVTDLLRGAMRPRDVIASIMAGASTVELDGLEPRAVDRPHDPRTPRSRSPDLSQGRQIP